LRADQVSEDVPSFEAVLARIAGEGSISAVGDEDSNSVVVAKVPRPVLLSTNVERFRASEGKHSFPRWAQGMVACAATAAVAVSFLGVTPPKTESMPVDYSNRDEVESGSDRVCTIENSFAPREILASMPLPREVKTETSAPTIEEAVECGSSAGKLEQCGDWDTPMTENACDAESAAMCSGGGP
jgi:hypothetical protein